ncbi:MAG: sulfotransferase [Synechococcales cyanobacterium M58_A2018_015]|jgi:hypothetical protein|nr:sulfotransferase [Synechococcales cyanobacterium M58_A2018_015]
MIILEQNFPLAVLVCGFEHSGTTMVSEMLRQHPQLHGGFEGGFLLNETAQAFLSTEPYYTNVKNGWGVTDAQMREICNSYTWAGVYAKLQDKAAILRHQSGGLVDKTPMYMSVLSDVLQRVPNVPCIVMVRDFRALAWSSFKRASMPLEQWQHQRLGIACKHMLSYAEGWSRAMADGLGHRLLLVQYEAFCADPIPQAQIIFDFLQLDFDPAYLSFGAGKHEFVYGNQVSNSYTAEYKQHLPDSICHRVIDSLWRYRDWLWAD